MSTSVPQPGSGLSSLYVNLLDSISGVKRRRDEILIEKILETRASAADVCCKRIQRKHMLRLRLMLGKVPSGLTVSYCKTGIFPFAM